MTSDGVRDASESGSESASERLDTRAAAAELRADRRREQALRWKMLAVLIIVCGVAIARELWWVHP